MTPTKRHRGTVYLAGPITGKTFSAANAWRMRAAYELRKRRFRTLSPLRDKAHLALAGLLPNDFDGGFDAVSQDLKDIRRCDIVLANFTGAGHASVGTCAEIGYAYGLSDEPGSREGPPAIVSIIPEHGPHDHVFIKYMSDYTTRTLLQAIEICEEVMP